MTEGYKIAPEEDQEIYDLIFTKFYKFVFVKALFIIKDRQETEDVVQCFFIDLWKNKQYLTLRSEMKGYLYTAIRNRSLNYLRDKETDRKRKENLLVDFDESVESKEEPPEYIMPLIKALNELPNQQKHALEIVYMQDKKYQEAADMMGISINSLKTHLKTGLKALRLRINNYI